MSGNMRGIDVAKWQGNIDWKKVKSSGCEFAILKVIRKDFGSTSSDLGMNARNQGSIWIQEKNFVNVIRIVLMLMNVTTWKSSFLPSMTGNLSDPPSFPCGATRHIGKLLTAASFGQITRRSGSCCSFSVLKK